MPAAGVPWFVTIFGRDSLVVAFQAALINPHLARGTLSHLAKYQAKKRDDWRDEQPGKILHEMRFGELAHFNNCRMAPITGPPMRAFSISLLSRRRFAGPATRAFSTSTGIRR